MILFLTYHRVHVPGDEKPPDVYTITPGTLAAHLDALEAAGLRPSSPETLVEPLSPGARRCYLAFDDGTVDHAQVVLPELCRRGWRAVFFVPTGKLDRPGRLSREQLRQLADAGQTIGCHGHEHRRMDRLGREEIHRELDLAVRTLREVTGTGPWIFAPPGGYMNAMLRAAALERGLRVIRTMRLGLNRRADVTALETVPVHRLMTARQFEAILAGRCSRPLYLAKETLKALVPIRIYERLRALIFRLGGAS